MNSKLWCLSVSMSMLLLVSSLGGGFAFAEEYTADYYFKKYAVEVVYSPTVETTFPTWAQPDENQEITDLNYWVHEVLPFDQDKQADRYLVYPKSGIVVPVLVPSAEDQTKIKQGEVFNHYPYLEQGSLFYFGSSPSERVGNMVIAAHSSYSKEKPGRYKTIFQALPISRIDDKVFYYEKNAQGSYDLYEYTVTNSFETIKTDVGILSQNVNKETLTTYGCYKIGTNDNRWVNVGELTKKTPKFVTLNAPAVHASAPTDSPKSADTKEVTVTAPSSQAQAPAPALTTQSVSTTATTPTTPTPLNTKLQAYLLQKKQSLSGTTNTGTATVMVSAPPKPVIEELPISLKIMYGPVLNRLVYHLVQQVRFNKPGIEQLIEKFMQHYEETSHPTKRLMQGYIIQKLSGFLE